MGPVPAPVTAARERRRPLRPLRLPQRMALTGSGSSTAEELQQKSLTSENSTAEENLIAGELCGGLTRTAGSATTTWGRDVHGDGLGGVGRTPGSAEAPSRPRRESLPRDPARLGQPCRTPAARGAELAFFRGAELAFFRGAELALRRESARSDPAPSRIENGRPVLEDEAKPDCAVHLGENGSRVVPEVTSC